MSQECTEDMQEVRLLLVLSSTTLDFCVRIWGLTMRRVPMLLLFCSSAPL